MLNRTSNIDQPYRNTKAKVSEKNRFELIAVHAFFLAEKHGFERYNWHDWQEAEREINAMIETTI